MSRKFDSGGVTFHNYVANYGNTNHIGRNHLRPSKPAYIQYLGSPFIGDDWNPAPTDEQVQRDYRWPEQDVDGFRNGSRTRWRPARVYLVGLVRRI